MKGFPYPPEDEDLWLEFYDDAMTRIPPSDLPGPVARDYSPPSSVNNLVGEANRSYRKSKDEDKAC